MPKTRSRDEEREYRRRYRARKRAELQAAGGLALLPGAPGIEELIDQRAARIEPRLPTRNVSSVIVELDDLGAFETCPTLAACAVAAARILDSEAQRAQHVPAIRALAEMIATIRSVAHADQSDDTKGVLDLDTAPASLRPVLRAV